MPILLHGEEFIIWNFNNRQTSTHTVVFDQLISLFGHPDFRKIIADQTPQKYDTAWHILSPVLWERRYASNNLFLEMLRAEFTNNWLNCSPMRKNSTAVPRALKKQNFEVKQHPVSSWNNVRLLLASSVEVKSKAKKKWVALKSSNFIQSPVLANWRRVIVIK